MSRLFNYFLRGLVVVVPLALTLYVCTVIFTTIDSWLGLRIRGVGFVLALVLITLVGFMASGLITRSLIGALDRTFERLPFVRLLYSSAKDMPLIGPSTALICGYGYGNQRSEYS